MVNHTFWGLMESWTTGEYFEFQNDAQGKKPRNILTLISLYT